MADDKGGWRERWHYRQVMRDNGAWSPRVVLPTREDYRRWLMVETEGPVHTLPRGQALEQWTEDIQARAAQLAERLREPSLERAQEHRTREMDLDRGPHRRGERER